MAKLYFYYSAMNAGKTTALLQSSHNYEERGMSTVLLKPQTDDREATTKIISRIGLTADATIFLDTENLYTLIDDTSKKHKIIFLGNAKWEKLIYFNNSFLSLVKWI